MSSTLTKEAVKKSYKDIMVVGIGNRLLGDEGIGLHIIDNLSKIPMPSNVNIIDCGCDLLSLANHLNKARKIIIVDAIRARGKPGEIYRFNYSDLGTTQAQTYSAHEIGTTNVLRLLKQVYPVLTNSEIIVIGVEPKTLGLSSDLSKEVRGSIADVTRLVVEEISIQSSFWQEEGQSSSDPGCAPLSCRTRHYRFSKRPGPRTAHTDAGKAQSWVFPTGSGQRVSTVDSGPAGLTCAWDLATLGYKPV